MEEPTQETITMQISRDHVAPLIGQFGMVTNELAPLIDLPPVSAAAAQAASAWWQGLSEEKRHTCRAALAAFSSPQLVIDVGINSRNERLTNTHAVVPSLRWNDPIFLFAADKDAAQYRLEYLRKAEIFTNTLLLYLQGIGPVYEMEMKFEVPVQDFAVLLALADLRQKLRLRALIDHEPYPESFSANDIAATAGEAFAFADPRWLLPFSLPVLHLPPDSLSPASVRQALDRLAKLGLIRKSSDSITITEPGERFCDSTAARTSSLGIEAFGVDAAGNHGRQSVLLIRGDLFLWYAGIGGSGPDSIVVTCIGLDQAEKLLEELFTPVAAPKPGEARTAAAVPAAGAQAAPKAQAGAAKHFCPSCGAPLKPNMKFCNNCGAKLG